MERPRTSVIVRWVVGAIIAAAATWLLVVGMGRETSYGGVVTKCLGGFALMIAACLFIGPEIVSWAIAPINYLLDAILMPSETIHPPVDYKLARFYYEQMRYEEACEEYFKILSYHPHEVSAYVEGIAAATAVNDSATAEKFYRMGLRKLSAQNGEREQFIQQLTNGPVTEPVAGTDEHPESGLLEADVEAVDNSRGDQATANEVHRDGREEQRDDL